tara:strand:- start:578 stop:2857 length:2280 start_codon:yes stop_codon:yes gene_type:complete
MSNVVQDYNAIANKPDQLINQIVAHLIQQAGTNPDAKRAWINLNTLNVNLRDAVTALSKAGKSIRESDARIVKTRMESRNKLLIQQSKSSTTTGVARGERQAEANADATDRQGKARSGSTAKNERIINGMRTLPNPTAEEFKRRLEIEIKSQYGNNYGGIASDPLTRPIVLDDLRAAVDQTVARQARWAPGAKESLNIDNWFDGKFGAYGTTHGDALDSSGARTGQTVSERERDSYVDAAVRLTYAAGNIATDGDALDFDTAYRIGMTTKGRDEGGLTKAISTAAFNKLKVENPELIERFGYADAFHEFMYSREGKNDPNYEQLFSELGEVGRSVNQIQYWNDDAYERLAQQTEDIKTEKGRLIQTIEKNTPSFAEIQERARLLYINMYGTTMERNTEKRQKELKKSFAEDQFFQQTYSTQKRIIDALPIPRSQRRKFKAFLRGDSGVLTGSDQAELLMNIEGFLKEARAEGQVIPEALQVSLQPQLQARGLTVHDEKTGEITGYNINDMNVPLGDLKYEDMVALASSIATENNMSSEQVGQMVENLATYAKHSLSGDFEAGNALNAMRPVIEAISKSPMPSVRYDLDVAGVGEDLVETEQAATPVVPEPVVPIGTRQPLDLNLEEVDEDLVAIESAMGGRASPYDASTGAATDGSALGNTVGTILTNQAGQLGGSITQADVLTTLNKTWKDLTGKGFDADGQIEKNRKALLSILNSGGAPEDQDKAFNHYFSDMAGNPAFKQEVYAYLGASGAAPSEE